MVFSFWCIGFIHPLLIGATDYSKNRKYYEDDTKSCKWLKETKCSKEKQPKRKKEKVCKWETHQVSSCRTPMVRIILQTRNWSISSNFQKCRTVPGKQKCETNSRSTYKPFTKETCEAELRGSVFHNVPGAWCKPQHTAQKTCKVSC